MNKVVGDKIKLFRESLIFIVFAMIMEPRDNVSGLRTFSACSP